MRTSPRSSDRKSTTVANAPATAADKGANGEIHGWYRSILGYPGQVVSNLLDEFVPSEKSVVLDPFCGAGTTLVECMKRGVKTIGIDASPASCFVSRVKTTWSVDPCSLRGAINRVCESMPKWLRRNRILKSDPAYQYLQSAGMIARGWISESPLLKVLAIKTTIANLRACGDEKNALRLALLSELVYNASNVKFGPELFCGPTKPDVDVLHGFRMRAEKMADDLLQVAELKSHQPNVILGDARQCDDALRAQGLNHITAVICSPPYPAEHDYTRNGRLELVLLEHVIDRESLRLIKRRMIRSHTKGIFKGDNDGSAVQSFPVIRRLVNEIQKRVRTKTHGFAELYPTVVSEYFGGMARHLRALHSQLKPRSICAYVVGDQASYLQTHIHTARILETIAKDSGYTSIGIRHLRSRWSTTTSRSIDENILLLRRT